MKHSATISGNDNFTTQWNQEQCPHEKKFKISSISSLNLHSVIDIAWKTEWYNDTNNNECEQNIVLNYILWIDAIL